MSHIRRKKINGVFAAGVTGGHIYPALSVAQEMEKMHPLNALFIGTGRGAEKNIYTEHFPYKRIVVHACGSDRSKLSYIYFNSIALMKSIFILKKTQADFVFTTGGYVGGIVAYAAHLLKIPIFLHESNVEVGISNKKISPYVKVSFCAFEQSKEELHNPFLSGTPVRNDFFLPQDSEFRKSFDGKKIVLIFGGSEGSELLDDITKKLSAKYKNIEFIHIGKRKIDSENVKHFYYVDDMAYLMRNVDAVICRAGASTLAEIMASKTPAILVPWKGSLNSHQTKNAKYLEDKGAAFVLDCDDGSKETEIQKIMEKVEKILDPKVNSLIRENLKKISPSSSPAKIIAKKILDTFFDN